MGDSVEREILRVLHGEMSARRRAYIASGVKTQGAYLTHLWADMRGFFHEETDGFGFIDAFTAEIDNQFRKAWNEGAREAGVDPRDMGDADLAQITDRIQAEYEHILGLADAIDAARMDGMTDQEFRAAFYNRAEMWANRYTDVKNEALLWFSRERLEWVLGPTEKHCSHNEKPGGWGCSNLSGIVAWAADWREAGVQPQGGMLSCSGFNCECELRPTKRYVTRGGIPRP